MSHGYILKRTHCECGNELGIFGYKCDTCKIKALKKNNPQHYKIHMTCDKCKKKLSGEIVEYQAGAMHRKCWLQSL